ncbi:hypothetical protein EGR_07603 [Echinococcus granulosus]|uniref:Uncharacterized protein n=1 Tax=Echinococcus granulosus TaxID=6210 RepID=W6UHF7_ECHGR|nr:hypothetical protein EGR_07603 [Echinococcus granulosus]EUB57512.1 hypothetical protein EGR_07603 [Echinococcus granulosus]
MPWVSSWSGLNVANQPDTNSPLLSSIPSSKTFSTIGLNCKSIKGEKPLLSLIIIPSNIMAGHLNRRTQKDCFSFCDSRGVKKTPYVGSKSVYNAPLVFPKSCKITESTLFQPTASNCFYQSNFASQASVTCSAIKWFDLGTVVTNFLWLPYPAVGKIGAPHRSSLTDAEESKLTYFRREEKTLSEYILKLRGTEIGNVD